MCFAATPAQSKLLRWLGLEYETGRVYSGMITRVNFKSEKNLFDFESILVSHKSHVKYKVSLKMVL